MKGKLVGISTVSAIILMLLIAILTFLSGEFFEAKNIKLFFVFFILSSVLVGIYLLKTHCKWASKKITALISIYGLLLVPISFLISFNIIDPLTTYNWLVSGFIFYILLVFLQLLKWGKKPSFLTKMASFTLISSVLFLIIYFIAAWSYSELKLWINLAIIIAISSIIIGLLGNKKQVESTSE